MLNKLCMRALLQVEGVSPHNVSSWCTFTSRDSIHTHTHTHTHKIIAGYEDKVEKVMQL